MSQAYPDRVAQPPAQGGFHPNNTRRSWIALACTALTLPIGIAAGSLMVAQMGYDPNNLEALPAGIALLTGSVTMAITLVAPLIAFFLGRKAMRAGDARGQVPMLIAGIGGAMFLASNLGQFALGLILG